MIDKKLLKVGVIVEAEGTTYGNVVGKILSIKPSTGAKKGLLYEIEQGGASQHVFIEDIVKVFPNTISDTPSQLQYEIERLYNKVERNVKTIVNTYGKYKELKRYKKGSANQFHTLTLGRTRCNIAIGGKIFKVKKVTQERGSGWCNSGSLFVYTEDERKHHFSTLTKSTQLMIYFALFYHKCEKK